jgi:hypothetical protein
MSRQGKTCQGKAWLVKERHGNVRHGIWTVHYKVTDMTVEVMLGFFSLEGNPLL